MFRKPYRTVALGGTFDHFHLGHQEFIRFAAQWGQQLLIGITTDHFIKHKSFSGSLQTLRIRKQNVIRFCQEHHIPFQLVELTDAYGPTITPNTADALIVTEETVKGASDINMIRSKLDLSPLPVHIFSMIKDERSDTISSSRIREGRISRQGIVYGDIFTHDVTLNEAQRTFFTQPQGEQVEVPDEGVFTAVVGDSSLGQFLSNEWSFNLGVYDLRERRNASTEVSSFISKPDFTVANPAGHITVELLETLQDTIQLSHSIVFVEGEEDLATVALVLLLPLNSIVYYGQPDQGLIQLEVSEQKKDEFYEVLKA